MTHSPFACRMSRVVVHFACPTSGKPPSACHQQPPWTHRHMPNTTPCRLSLLFPVQRPVPDWNPPVARRPPHTRRIADQRWPTAADVRMLSAHSCEECFWEWSRPGRAIVPPRRRIMRKSKPWLSLQALAGPMQTASQEIEGASQSIGEQQCLGPAS